MTYTIPPYLKPGDTIGLVCPAGYMPMEKIQCCIETLINWGFKVVPGKTLGNQYHYFSGTDEERLADLQKMMNDKKINAILCARGGYGMGRIIDQIDFKPFIKKPKWVIGFSDITVLHSHLLSRYKIASMHAPMAAAFNDGENKNEYILSLHDALLGRKATYNVHGDPNNQPGDAQGILCGGNLSLLANITGTPSQVNTKNKILFIEDVGEYIYNIDRMLYQLSRSGQFDNLKGLIIGMFTDTKDTTVPFGKTVMEVIKEHTSQYNFPVCFNFPVSHEKENFALKIGVKYQLKVSMTHVELKEK